MQSVLIDEAWYGSLVTTMSTLTFVLRGGRRMLELNDGSGPLTANSGKRQLHF
jgi:hypothetical protein